MNVLFVATLASLAALSIAAPSGIHGAGAILSGPSGIVTSAGPIGPAGHGLGLGLGLGAGLGHGGLVAAPAIAAAPIGLAAPVLAGPALGLGLGHGLGVVTNGGGTIGVSAHGATVRGPPTAPVVVAGPAGKVVADGLWGPTANVGLTGYGGWSHGALGHGW